MNNLEILGWVIKNNKISILPSFTYSGLIMDIENDIPKFTIIEYIPNIIYYNPSNHLRKILYDL